MADQRKSSIESKAAHMVAKEFSELKSTFEFFVQCTLLNCPPEKLAHIDARAVMCEVLRVMVNSGGLESTDSITDTLPRDMIIETVLLGTATDYPNDEIKSIIEESYLGNWAVETKAATIDQLLEWGLEHYRILEIPAGRALDHHHFTDMMNALEERFPKFRHPTIAEISARA